VVVRYLIPHLILDVGGGRHDSRQTGRAGRDGDGGDGQVDGDGEAKRGCSDRVAGLLFMATVEQRRVGDEPRQAGLGGGKTTTGKWAPCQIFSKTKIKHPKLNSPREIARGEKNSQKNCGERRCNLEQLL
jgi:hypothetical protein